MATNENVNKVIYGNQTVMDITDTTAEESDVASGEVFYKANGARSVGTLNADSAVWGNISGTLSDQEDLQIELNRAYTKTASETSSLDDLDLIPVQKIFASSDGRRNIKFRNLKSILKTYFDTIYSTFSGSYNDLTNKPTAGTGIAINNNVIAVDADNTPTENSEKPVKSKGVYSALESSREESTTLLKSTVGWTGKNEFPITITSVKENNTVGSWNRNAYTLNGITYTLSEDGKGNVTEIDADGISTGNAVLILVPYKQYTGNKIISGCNGGSSTTYELLMMSSTSGDLHCYNGDTSITPLSDRNYQARILVKSGQTLSHQKFYPMLRDASITDDTYEPYHESVEEVVEQIYADNGVLGAKNLCELFKGVTDPVLTKTKDDATGTATLSGTSTSTGWGQGLVYQYQLPAGKYKVTRTASSNNFCLLLNWDSQGTITDDGKIFEVDGNITVRLGWLITANKSINLTASGVMLRLASDPDDTYAPYAMTNRELTEEKLSISELKTIASSAADFAAFKTAIANL